MRVALLHYWLTNVRGGEKGVYFEGRKCENGILPLKDGSVTVRV